jgi:hypothetical protein
VHETCYSTPFAVRYRSDETLYFNELSGPILVGRHEVYDKALADTKDERKASRRGLRSGRRHQRRWQDHAAVEYNHATNQRQRFYQGDTGAAPPPAAGAAAGQRAGGGGAAEDAADVCACSAIRSQARYDGPL